MIDAALFDWDGTLLDSRSALLGAWHAATQAVLGRRWPTNAEEEELVFTLPGSQLFPSVAGDAAAAERLRAAFQDAYETTGERVRAFPGVADMLAELRQAGLRIGVITSKERQRFELDARRIALADLIDLAVCQEDTRAHKPDPAPVRHALDTLGVAAERAVFTGDTPVDVAAGTAAGTSVIGVEWGAAGARPLLDAGASVVAENARELTRLLLRRE